MATWLTGEQMISSSCDGRNLRIKLDLTGVSASRFGRKMTFLVSNLLNGIAGILVALAPNYVSLLVLRALFGFGVKGGWVVGYVLSKNDALPPNFPVTPTDTRLTRNVLSQ